MADTVRSAVIEETVSSIISSISRKVEEKVDLSETIERLEIAQMKMEVALDMSKKWQISSMPLLRWRGKLKRAAQECDSTLRQCKQRAIEAEDIRQHASQSSFANRIVHATKSLVSSFIDFGKDESSTDCSTNARRFERIADGATEFLKFVEFGGTTPRQYMFFNPLIGHLLTGKAVRYQVLEGSKFSYFGIRPMNFADRGVEALIGFISIDLKDPLKGLHLIFLLRLSDSTDIIGVMTKCLQSVTPHLKFAGAEHVNGELIGLPTQDFSILTHSPYIQSGYWVNVHNTMTTWCRPDPLCCNEHDHQTPCSRRSTGNTASSLPSRLLCDVFPEEIITVFLQCRILFLPADQHRNRQRVGGGGGSLNNPCMQLQPLLRMGILLVPHASPPEFTDPAVESYAVEVIDEEEQDTVHTNACLGDLGETLLPKAVGYLYENAESRMYQMCLKTRHGNAHLCVEKTTTSAGMQSALRRRRRRSSKASGEAQAPTNRRVPAAEDNRSEQWKQVARDLLKLRVVRASDKFQDSIRSWSAVHSMP